MWSESDKHRFDATVWKGQGDITTVTVRLSMLFGLAILWLSLMFGIFHLS